MALTKDRDTERASGDLKHVPLKAGAKVFMGGQVCLNAGYGVAGSDAAGLVFQGIAMETVDNTDGQDGDLSVTVYARGLAKLKNSGIAITDEGKTAFVHDDETVKKATTHSVAAGRIVKYVSATEVWIDLGYPYERVAALVAPIADPENTTLPAVATQLNALLTALTNANLMSA